MPLEPYEDPDHPNNGPEHRTGRACIDCPEPAGTAWSHLWCFACNAKRMRRIDTSLKAIAKRMEGSDQ